MNNKTVYEKLDSGESMIPGVPKVAGFSIKIFKIKKLWQHLTKQKKSEKKP